MKVVHGIKSEDIMMNDMLDVMHKYVEERAKETGRTVIFPEDFTGIVSRIYTRICMNEKHFIEM